MPPPARGGASALPASDLGSGDDAAEGVVPISCTARGQLWHALRGTRMAGIHGCAGGWAGARWLLSGFLRRHLACMPRVSPELAHHRRAATRRRSQRHPLEKVVRRSFWLRRATWQLRTGRAGPQRRSDAAFKSSVTSALRCSGGRHVHEGPAAERCRPPAGRGAGRRRGRDRRVVNPEAPRGGGAVGRRTRTPWRLNRLLQGRRVNRGTS